MSNLSDLARPAIDSLLQSDESQLYEELAIRLKAMGSDPAKSGSFAPAVTYDAATMGFLDDLRDFGKRFMERMNVSFYNLVCGKQGEDVKERKKVAEAFGIGKTEVAAVLAGLLVSEFGLAPAIAAVVASLIIKLFFRNAYEAMCEVWKGKLPQ